MNDDVEGGFIMGLMLVCFLIGALLMLGGYDTYQTKIEKKVSNEFLNSICQEFTHNEHARVDWENAPFMYTINDSLNCVIPTIPEEQPITNDKISVVQEICTPSKIHCSKFKIPIEEKQ